MGWHDERMVVFGRNSSFNQSLNFNSNCDAQGHHHPYDKSQDCLYLGINVSPHLTHNNNELSIARMWQCDHHTIIIDDSSPSLQTKDNKIKEIDTSTSSTISEWPVPHDNYLWISLLQHKQFIAYSMRHNVTFWDTSTHIQFGLIPQSVNERSITFSPSSQLLALADNHKIIIWNLSLVNVCPPMSMLLFLICTSHTRGQTFMLKVLYAMHGRMVNSPMWKHY